MLTPSDRTTFDALPAGSVFRFAGGITQWVKLDEWHVRIYGRTTPQLLAGEFGHAPRHVVMHDHWMPSDEDQLKAAS